MFYVFMFSFGDVVIDFNVGDMVDYGVSCMFFLNLDFDLEDY